MSTFCPLTKKFIIHLYSFICVYSIHKKKNASNFIIDYNEYFN